MRIFVNNVDGFLAGRGRETLFYEYTPHRNRGVLIGDFLPHEPLNGFISMDYTERARPIKMVSNNRLWSATSATPWQVPATHLRQSLWKMSEDSLSSEQGVAWMIFS